MVTDHHLFAPLIEAGVDMKGNVVTSQKVHCEPVEDIFVPPSSVFLQCTTEISSEKAENCLLCAGSRGNAYILAFGLTLPRMVIIILS